MMSSSDAKGTAGEIRVSVVTMAGRPGLETGERATAGGLLSFLVDPGVGFSSTSGSAGQRP